MKLFASYTVETVDGLPQFKDFAAEEIAEVEPEGAEMLDDSRRELEFKFDNRRDMQRAATALERAGFKTRREG